MTRAGRPPALDAWHDLGAFHDLGGHEVFAVDVPPDGVARAEPLLVLHGFPSSSFDFHLVLDDLRRDRRVVLLDLLGYGFSAKPDLAYTIDLQADLVGSLADEIGLSEVALLTHDMGDTVGGELLARQAEGRGNLAVTRRVLTNGSIYIGMAQLSAGQLMLLGLPDARLDPGSPIDGAAVAAGVAATFHPDAAVPDDEIAAIGALVANRDGHLVLARLIRYIEERRRRERRYTGAIESHPSPLSVVWGVDDPIAVVAMVDRLVSARPDATVTRLDGVGHYPMLEAPRRFADAVTAALA